MKLRLYLLISMDFTKNICEVIYNYIFKNVNQFFWRFYPFHNNIDELFYT